MLCYITLFPIFLDDKSRIVRIQKWLIMVLYEIIKRLTITPSRNQMVRLTMKFRGKRVPKSKIMIRYPMIRCPCGRKKIWYNIAFSLTLFPSTKSVCKKDVVHLKFSWNIPGLAIFFSTPYLNFNFINLHTRILVLSSFTQCSKSEKITMKRGA